MCPTSYHVVILKNPTNWVHTKNYMFGAYSRGVGGGGCEATGVSIA